MCYRYSVLGSKTIDLEVLGDATERDGGGVGLRQV